MLQPTPTDPQSATETVEGRAQRQAPVMPPPQLDPAWRAGRKLSEARRHRGWTLDDAADRIRSRREFLEALEDMNIKLLPGKAYALAFLRSYARELGIDEKAIVDQFQDESALTREDVQKQIRNPTSKPRRERPCMFAAALVLLAAAFVSWRALSQNEQPAAEAPTVTQASTAVAAPAQ